MMKEIIHLLSVRACVRECGVAMYLLKAAKRKWVDGWPVIVVCKTIHTHTRSEYFIV